MKGLSVPAEPFCSLRRRKDHDAGRLRFFSRFGLRRVDRERRLDPAGPDAVLLRGVELQVEVLAANLHAHEQFVDSGLEAKMRFDRQRDLRALNDAFAVGEGIPAGVIGVVAGERDLVDDRRVDDHHPVGPAVDEVPPDDPQLMLVDHAAERVPEPVFGRRRHRDAAAQGAATSARAKLERHGFGRFSFGRRLGKQRQVGAARMLVDAFVVELLDPIAGLYDDAHVQRAAAVRLPVVVAEQDEGVKPALHRLGVHRSQSRQRDDQHQCSDQPSAQRGRVEDVGQVEAPNLPGGLFDRPGQHRASEVLAAGVGFVRELDRRDQPVSQLRKPFLKNERQRLGAKPSQQTAQNPYGDRGA